MLSDSELGDVSIQESEMMRGSSFLCKMKNANLVIWDWNGTLLNDVSLCISSMNRMLERRSMPLLCLDQYRDIFTFPVKKYYFRVGFDFSIDSFEDLSHEYISQYGISSEQCCLFPGVLEVLHFLKKKGVSQIILSAMEQRSLERQVMNKDIDHYFDDIIGLGDIYAKGKIEAGKEYFLKNGKKESEKSVLIGDTYHDFEVAKALNCKSILINNGHQNLENYTFNAAIPVLSTIEMVMEMFH
jgi:phosphoglycolate phosphatase